MKSRWLGLSLAAALAASGVEAAQYVYPAKGQDKAQQAKDLAECGAWATQQSGVDPAKLAAQTAKANTSKATTDQAMAALGAVSGKSSGKTAAVAGIGSVLAPTAASGASANSAAITSALGAYGGKRGAQAATAIETANAVNQIARPKPQATAAPVAAGQADYDQARAACLTGRGYSVR